MPSYAIHLAVAEEYLKKSNCSKENHEKDTEQTSPVKNERVSFPWWIVAVIAAVVIGGGILAIVLIRKGSDK